MPWRMTIRSMQTAKLELGLFSPNPRHTDSCAADSATLGRPKADGNLLLFLKIEVDKTIVLHGRGLDISIDSLYCKQRILV